MRLSRSICTRPSNRRIACSNICSRACRRASRSSARSRAATPPRAVTDGTTAMAKVTMIEAINRAHAWEMAHDQTVVVLGEDVGVNGGVFRATAGLLERFGKDRVQDTPL